MPHEPLDRRPPEPTADRRLRQMTEGLRECEDRFRGAFNAAAIGIALVAPDGRWLEVNRALCEILGYPQAELLATTFQAITHPDDLDHDLGLLRRLVAGELPNYQVEKRYFHKSGDIVPIHLSVSVVRDPLGQPLYFVALIQDLSARKEAEQERDRFFSHSLTPMCVLGYDGAIKSFNPAVEATFGFSGDELLTHSFLDFVHPADRARSADEVQRVVAGATTREFELRCRCQDGSYKWMAWNAVSIAERQAIYAIGHDVTDRHIAQEALAESERFAHSTLDALRTHIAILDEQGAILATNSAWREFASANRATTEVGVGANYLDACDRAIGYGAAEGASAAAGIRAVMRGEQDEFVLEYPCHSPPEQRWFRARATRFAGDGPLRVVVSHETITEARLAEEERQKFVSLVENSTDFIGMATLSGEVIYTNPAACRLVGLDPLRSWAGTRISDYYSEAGRRVLDDVALPAVRAVGQWEGEIQFRGVQAGPPIETASSIFMVRHPQSGEPLCMATVVRDITDRKRREAELRQARAQLMDAIESLDAGLVMYGPDERLVVCNTRYKEMYAACAHAMVPGTPYEDILRVFAGSSANLLADLSADEWVARRLAAHRHPGEPSVQRLADRWIRIGDHRTSDGGVVSLRTDITPLMQAQELAESANLAYQQQVDELEHLYITAPVGLELLDREFRVLRVNERLALINGKSIQEHIGRTLREIVPQFAPRIEAAVDQVFASGESLLDIEIHGVTPADPANERDWLVSYYPVKAPDGVPRFVGCVVLEITELKKVEADLRRAKADTDAASRRILAQKEFLQNVIDTIPCAVFWKDRQSVNLGGNQLAARDLGFASPAEMIGKSNFDLPISRTEAEAYTRFDREVMESGQPMVNFEEVLTRPDGQRWTS